MRSHQQRIPCPRCRLSPKTCYCSEVQPFSYPAHFSILQHPRESRNALGSGRMTALHLKNSSLHVGVQFENCSPLNQWLAKPDHLSVLLYPGPRAWNLSDSQDAAHLIATTNTQQLHIIVIDGTWSTAKKTLLLNPHLARLPWISFDSTRTSEYRIRPQPHALCLSTLEAVHECMIALDRANILALPSNDAHNALLHTFRSRIQRQIEIATDPTTPGYRRNGHRDIHSIPTAKRWEKRKLLFNPKDS